MTWTTMTVGQVTVRVLTLGEGAPLLYLHGFQGHPEDAPFLQALAKERTVIAPEHPGYGESGGADLVDDILTMALHYRGLVEQLGHGPVDLAGHSLGGMFAAELAAIAPQVVRRLVLVSPFGLWLQDNQVPDVFAMNDAAMSAAAWADPEVAKSAKPAKTGSGIPGTLTRTANLAMATNFLWPIPDRGLSKRLPLITAPTLVLTGQADKIIPPVYGEAFATAIPGARSVVISGAGHHAMLEREPEFVAAVTSFLGVAAPIA